MKSIKNWSLTQVEKIFNIAIINNQVGNIINDPDVKEFYKLLLEENKSAKYREIIKSMLEI